MYDTAASGGEAETNSAAVTNEPDSIAVDEPFLCTFDGTEADIATDARVKVTGKQTTCTEGTVNELGTNFTKLLKMESGTQISFSTATEATLKLYVDTAAKRIKVDGVMYTAETTESGDNVVTFDIGAGAKSITKGDAIGLYSF